MTAFTLPLGLILMVLAGCGMPRDPDGTLERVRQEKVVRAGAIAAEPWVVSQGNIKLEGVEVKLVEDFARSLGAEVSWTTAPEHELLKAVGERHLDIVVGGIKEDTSYKDKIGLTKPYLKTDLYVGCTTGSRTLPADIEDQEVFHEKSRASLGHVIENEGAIPKPIEHLVERLQGGLQGVVVDEQWRLEAWGLVVSDEKLEAYKYVIAVPQGENRWLLCLEKFLAGKESDVNFQLQLSERQRANVLLKDAQP